MNTNTIKRFIFFDYVCDFSCACEFFYLCGFSCFYAIFCLYGSYVSYRPSDKVHESADLTPRSWEHLLQYALLVQAEPKVPHKKVHRLLLREQSLVAYYQHMFCIRNFLLQLCAVDMQNRMVTQEHEQSTLYTRWRNKLSSFATLERFLLLLPMTLSLLCILMEQDNPARTHRNCSPLSNERTQSRICFSRTPINGPSGISKIWTAPTDNHTLYRVAWKYWS